ncbi:PEP-CTERM sorting domain-containing protein [Persicirhabdus sediminis]|uniref:PEP-CTERM sorting domain-containing protein n=1 Tax=Persicirhabdus sediminis TaxID=454144 RepID=A0A8J7SH44_9BACT|nr:PEP-CTERM sorting domain-containing protein [Persicirhabdus sediminis]MBK1790545.1 PEP-CTERM sorting domain-containing protein [Persicirhabdus sediminis]
MKTPLSSSLAIVSLLLFMCQLTFATNLPSSQLEINSALVSIVEPADNARSVPEPSVMLLSSLAILLILRRRRCGSEF